ncbi:MAG TPA: H-NS histone family protein [Roseateles sp.]
MATSYSRIHAQIAKLQQQADSLKQAAIKRVQREISLHGLTPEDLFGSGTSVGNGRRANKARKAVAAKSAKAPKYGDSAGNTWVGMGKRPQWLRDALDQGAALEDFLLEAAAKPPVRKSKSAPAAAKSKAARKPAASKRRSKRATANADASTGE